MDGVGNFAVAWAGQDGSLRGVEGQRYDSAGETLGETTGLQYAPDIAMNTNGDFIVVWHSHPHIQGQRYTSDGSPDGGEFQINSYTGANGNPAAAIDQTGNFVVIWDTGNGPGRPVRRRLGKAGPRWSTQ